MPLPLPPLNRRWWPGETLAARRPQTTGATGEEDSRRGHTRYLPGTLARGFHSTGNVHLTGTGHDRIPLHHHRETRPHGPNNLTSLLLSSESGHRFWNHRDLACYSITKIYSSSVTKDSIPLHRSWEEKPNQT